MVKYLSTLSDFEQRTWPEISATATVGTKRVPTASLAAEAQARLRKIQRDDTDALWEIRVGNKPRLWGQRHGSTMCFIWWDAEHTVCPVARHRSPTGN